MFRLVSRNSYKVGYVAQKFAAKETTAMICYHRQSIFFRSLLSAIHQLDKSSRRWNNSGNGAELGQDNSNVEMNFNRIVNGTLEALQDYFDEILETNTSIQDPDTSLSDGVLTVKLGSFGTYVINKQTPNKQIWLSSPISGPKRYDYVNGEWIYKYDQLTIHQLLTKELRQMTGDMSIDFDTCKN